MPPAYTRIDYSHDSIDSTTPKGPVITVEDTGSQVNVSLNKITSPGFDSRQSSFDKSVFVENGGHPPPTSTGATLMVKQEVKGGSFYRNNSRYGVPIDENAVKMVYKQRSQRLNTRVQITDRCLILAMIGVVFMVLDVELCGQEAFGITKVGLTVYCWGGAVAFLALTRFSYSIAHFCVSSAEII
uniref:Uncharacterized protein n=1 Tax=Panagrolaimus sp. JU765 TaxID=591449 RepID=A0AC34QAY8_9BILA